MTTIIDIEQVAPNGAVATAEQVETVRQLGQWAIPMAAIELRSANANETPAPLAENNIWSLEPALGWVLDAAAKAGHSRLIVRPVDRLHLAKLSALRSPHPRPSPMGANSTNQ